MAQFGVECVAAAKPQRASSQIWRKWRVEVSDTASSHIGPNHDAPVLSVDCVRNKAYRQDKQAQKKRATARFLLSPRLLPAAGTFMVGRPSIGSNTIAARENLTSYPEGYSDACDR
jgi:hypothetical protein